VDMICIEGSESIAKLHKLILDTQYSRIPVYNTRFDNIIGAVSMKMLLKYVSKLDGTTGIEFESLSVDQIMEKPVFVPETMSLLNALKLLKERTLAICVDEYGGTTGLVTLEDCLEEIVGEIYDPDEEKDQVERARNLSQIQETAPGRFSMMGVADIDDVEEVLCITLPEGDYNSIGGFVCSVIDRIPVAGEAVIVQTERGTIRFEVVEVDDRKVLRLESQSSAFPGQESNGSHGNDQDSDDEKSDAEYRHPVLEVKPEIAQVEEDDGFSDPLDDSIWRRPSRDFGANITPLGGDTTG
ncbi:unnamed protein product, partial [Polarella glacialis]